MRLRLKIKIISLFSLFYYYLWILLYFLVLFIGYIVLFQLTFTFIYNIVCNNFPISVK